jgi:hypothetical protein
MPFSPRVQFDRQKSAIIRLFNRGVFDPSAEDIAEEYYGDFPYGEGDIDDIRKRLVKFRKAIEEDHNGTYPTCLLSKTYYRAFRSLIPRVGPIDWTAAFGFPSGTDDLDRAIYRCVVSRGNVSYGLWLNRRDMDEDKIFEAAQEHRLVSGVPAVKNAVKDLAHSYLRGSSRTDTLQDNQATVQGEIELSASMRKRISARVTRERKSRARKDLKQKSLFSPSVKKGSA